MHICNPHTYRIQTIWNIKYFLQIVSYITGNISWLLKLSVTESRLNHKLFSFMTHIVRQQRMQPKIYMISNLFLMKKIKKNMKIDWLVLQPITKFFQIGRMQIYFHFLLCFYKNDQTKFDMFVVIVIINWQPV